MILIKTAWEHPKYSCTLHDHLVSDYPDMMLIVSVNGVSDHILLELHCCLLCNMIIICLGTEWFLNQISAFSGVLTDT